MSDLQSRIQIGSDTYFQLGFENIPEDGKQYAIVGGKVQRTAKLVESGAQSGDMTVLAERLANLEQQFGNMKYGTDVKDITGNTNINKPNDPYVASGEITESTKIVAKDIVLSDVTVTSAPLNATASEDIVIKGYELNGKILKSVTNASVSLHADGFVTVRDSQFNNEGYNAIEIGLGTGLAKSIVVDGIDFAGKFSNNAVNVFGMAEGGVLTISNCHFGSVSNAVRISNRDNTHFTINLINCQIDKWDSNTEWQGAMIFQDYTSGSAEMADENDQFSKITLNVQNLILPDGSKLNPEDISSICGTGDRQQVFYLWDNWRGTVPYGDKYPQITIK